MGHFVKKKSIVHYSKAAFRKEAGDITRVNIKHIDDGTIAGKGEFVIVVAPPPEQVVSEEAIAARLNARLGRLSVRDAAREVASELGVPRKTVYQMAVKLARGGQGEQGK